MKKLFGLMMFVVMLFCFGSVSMAGGEFLPSNLKAQYDSGEITSNGFCSGMVELGINIMQTRQMGAPKRVLLMEIEKEFTGYNLEIVTLFIEKAYNHPQYYGHDSLVSVFSQFDDEIWDYCQGNMLD